MILVRSVYYNHNKTILLLFPYLQLQCGPSMIYQHVNERKKKRIRSPESLFCPPHSSSLVFLLRLGYCRAHPIPTLNKFSSIVTGNLCPFQVFDDVCSQFDVFLALDLAPWKESKTPENNQIVKVSSTKNYSTTTRNYCYIYLHTCRIFRR